MAEVKATRAGLLALAFVDVAIVAILALWALVPLDSLATPTTLCEEEIVAVAAVFVVFVAVMHPVQDALAGSKAPVSRPMRRRVGVPRPAKAAALALFALGASFFAFWATADVLGGYSGYSYTFSWYPVFGSIYDGSVGLVPFVSSLDKGTQASIYAGLATLVLVVLRLNRGFGAALKDAVTLFVAPCMVVFELALWSRAPEDMTWHVTDFLWIGGIADGGIRQNDFLRVPFANYAPGPGGHFLGTYASGPYLFSNWLVLFVGLFLVASRVPWMSLPSAILWRRRAARSKRAVLEGERGMEVPRVGLSAPWGAFEPTTLRFLWPDQAGRVGQGRPLQPEAFGSLTDLPG